MTTQLKDSELPCFCGNCGIYNLCFEKNTDDIKYYLDYFDSNKKYMKEYDYMVRMEVLGRSYKRATDQRKHVAQAMRFGSDGSWNPSEPVWEEDMDEDEDTVEVEEILVTEENTIDLLGTEDFTNKFMNELILVGCDVINGKKLVFPGSNELDIPTHHPLRHIYYDNRDKKFKEERNWTHILFV